MAKQYTIRELADEFDVTTRTLRFYEEKGLLKPARNKTTRSYGSADRTRLKLILRGKRLGLTLEESSAIVLMYNPGSQNSAQLKKLITTIQTKRAQLIKQQSDLDLMLADLKSAEQRATEALASTRKTRNRSKNQETS